MSQALTSDRGALEAPARDKSPVERFLSLFTEVRAGEGKIALLLTLDVFLVLVSYYLLKVVREPLILLGGAFGLEGATLKAAASAAQALLLLGVVPAYTFLASRVNRVKLITIVTLIFSGCLVVFYLLALIQVPLGLTFFIWIGIFNLMIIAQFWSFANDVYTEEQGKRLFAIVAFGGTAGAIVGAKLGGILAGSIGPYQVMLVAGGLLVVCALLTGLANRLTAGVPKQGQKSNPGASLGSAGGFGLVWKSRYLVLVAFMVLLYNTVNTNGEFILGDTVTEHAKEVAAKTGISDPKELASAAGKIIGAFYGDFYMWVNAVTAVVQLFLVSRIFKWFGVRAALFVLPVIALGGYVVILALPSLVIIKVAKVLENGTDYSLQNTARQALFLPTGREQKYKAKAAIDTFFVRFGDLASFGLVFAATAWLGLRATGVAAINVVLIAFWLLLVVGIAVQHRRLSKVERCSNTARRASRATTCAERAR